jgi:hypothetical protein
VVSTSLSIAVACSGSATEDLSASTAETPSAPASSTQQDTTSIDGSVIGTGRYPDYTVEAPSGWSTLGGHFVVKSGSGVLGVSVWDVWEVAVDPCHWHGNLVDPGPTVEDLVSALSAQKMRHATEPIDVTLDGYDGQYLEWSVPDDMVVTGDADFKGCDVEPSNGHLDFVSWTGNSQGERYQQVAGQIDRLWVLDVGGQRLLIDATYSPDTTTVDREELEQVAESLRFEDPAAS